MPHPALISLGLDYRPALLGSSGIGRAVRELSRALAEQGECDLHLFGHSLAAARRQDPLPQASRLHRLPIPGRSLGLLARLGMDAARLCGGVQLFHWTDYVYPPVQRARRVLTLHDLAFIAEDGFHGPAQSRLLAQRCQGAVDQADLLICPSQATAATARAHLKLGDTEVRVIGFGADHVPRHSLARPLTEDYLLMLGTIEPRKNHLRMLKAWRSLPAPRPKMVVIGRIGWCCAAEVALLRRLGSEGLLWLQDCPDPEVFAWMQHARALCYPSLLEGFGFPPLEALRLGVPVLAGDTPALREVCADTPVYAPPLEVEALRAGLIEVLDNEDQERRAAGVAHASSYTWDACARQHGWAYQQVLDR